MATSRSLLLGGWVVAAFAVPALSSSLSIEHKPPSCALAEQFPRIEACVSPASELARARVYFQALGAPYWSHVEMTPAGSCLGAVLPKPARSARGIVYYVVAEDAQAAEVETRQVRLSVVDSAAACAAGGILAPVASVTSVIVGSAPGAPSVPFGFMKAGISGAGMSGGLTAISVVGAGVAVGGVSAMVARSDSAAPVSNSPSTTTPVGRPPTTTLPGPPSTSVPPTTAPPGTTPPTTRPPATTPPSTTPPTTTPPTTTPGCGDNSSPDVDMTSPGNGPLAGPTAVLEAAASDAGSGIREVRFYVRETNTGQETLVGSDDAAPYSVAWSLPGCSGPSADPYKIWAEAEDNCGNSSQSGKVNVVLCAQQASQSASVASTWVQRLEVPGGSGQVVLNGAAVTYSGAGSSPSSFVPRSGENQVVATLLEGRGPGLWHFAFPSGVVEAGSLAPIAGSVSLLTADAIAFQMAGKPGERVVFRFRVR